MRLRIALALALVLVVLTAVPALAAPRVTIESTLWVGWFTECLGIDNDEKTGTKNGYPDSHSFGPYLIPGLRVSVGAWPTTDIVLSGWFTGCFCPADFYEPYVTEPGRALGLASVQLGVENTPAAAPNVRLLSGIKWMYLSADNGYEYVHGNMAGPYVGFAVRKPIAGQLMLTGQLTTAVLMGEFDYDDGYYPVGSSRGGDYEGIDGAYPVFEWDLGLKYNFSQALYIEGGVRGCTIVGAPVTTAYYRHPEGYGSALTLFGAYTTLGYQF